MNISELKKIMTQYDDLIEELEDKRYDLDIVRSSIEERQNEINELHRDENELVESISNIKKDIAELENLLESKNTEQLYQKSNEISSKQNTRVSQSLSSSFRKTRIDNNRGVCGRYTCGSSRC